MTNQLYLNHALKKCDILLIQEHWMYSFDKQKMKDLTKSHLCEVKSVDDNMDTEIIIKNRGYGGVAVYWGKDIDNSVQFRDKGNERVVVLSFNIIGEPMCIIGVYMPSDNKNGDEQYLDMLSQLEETINKYHSNGHQVIVCGDMNASTNRDNRSRDKHFQHFLERNSLRQTDDYPNNPTFYHHNGLYTSQIDFILHKGRESNISYKVQNEGLHPLNASDHCLLTAKFHVKLKNTKNTNRTPQIVKKPNWNKCEKEKYQESVQQSLKKARHQQD